METEESPSMKRWRREGGAAFPTFRVELVGHQAILDSDPGVTKRDWFAVMASDKDVAAVCGEMFTSPYTSADRTAARYRWADRMMAMREEE